MTGIGLLTRSALAFLALGACASCTGIGALRPGEVTYASVSQKLIVKCFPVLVGSASQPFLENTYLAYDSRTADALLVDPGARSAKMERLIEKRSLRVLAILNTHGHEDHIGANGYYAGKYRAPIYAHVAEKLFFEEEPYPVSFIEKEGPLTIGGFKIEVLHMPGHSPGSVAFHLRGVLFSGDTLFSRGIGRTWGDSREEERRLEEEEKFHIRGKLFLLPGQTPVYPGHREATTIRAEKRGNPYVKIETEKSGDLPAR